MNRNAGGFLELQLNFSHKHCVYLGIFNHNSKHLLPVLASKFTCGMILVVAVAVVARADGHEVKGAEIDGVQILRSGQRRGVTRTMKAMIKRRSAIEPTIDHMKSLLRLLLPICGPWYWLGRTNLPVTTAALPAA